MPQYRPEDLDEFVEVPLDVLARTAPSMSEAEVKERKDAALHEAAHLMAAICYRADVSEVTLTTTGRETRRKPAGSVQVSVKRVEHDAIISYVGLAWEELHGEARRAGPDMVEGDRLAAEPWCEGTRDDLLTKAREFVLIGDRAIRVVAACLLAVTPKSGVLRGRTLKRLLAILREPEDWHPGGSRTRRL